MEPNRAGGENDPTTESSTAIQTDAAGADNDSQQTLACGACDSTNIRAIQGDTGVGRHPTGEGPYACNDCGWHGEPVERPKRTNGSGRRGLAGQLVGAESDDLRADGGSKYHTQTGDGYVGTYTVRDTSCEVNAVTLGYERGEDIALVTKGDRTVALTTDATTTEALKVGTVNEEGFLSVGKAVQHHLDAAVGDDLRLYDVELGHLLVNADDDPLVSIPLKCESCDWLHYYRERVRGEDTKLKCPKCRGGGVTRLIEETAATDDEPAPIAGEGGAAGGEE